VKQRWLEVERKRRRNLRKSKMVNKKSKFEKIVLDAKVVDVDSSEINFEFGRVQAWFSISGSGGLQRKLKLKEGDKINLTIEKKK